MDTAVLEDVGWIARRNGAARTLITSELYSVDQIGRGRPTCLTSGHSMSGIFKVAKDEIEEVEAVGRPAAELKELRQIPTGTRNAARGCGSC